MLLGLLLNLSSDSMLRLIQTCSLIIAIAVLWIFSLRELA